MKSPVEFDFLLKVFPYVTWFNERRNWTPDKQGLFSNPIISLKQ